MAELGFVLTPTYRLVAGRPQVHLYAMLACGEPALIVDTRFRPYCYVRASDRERARPALGRLAVRETELRTFAGEPCLRIELDMPAEVPMLRRRLAEVGVPAFESDVRFAYRYCIDHGVRGAFRVDGAYERRPGVGRVYRDPEIALNAPYTTPVRRLDEAGAARKPVVRQPLD